MVYQAIYMFIIVDNNNLVFNNLYSNVHLKDSRYSQKPIYPKKVYLYIKRKPLVSPIPRILSPKGKSCSYEKG